MLADDSLLEVDSTVRAAEIQLRSIANELKREQLLAEAARREARTLELQGILTDAQQKTASSPGSAAGRKSRTAKSEPERERSTFSRDLSDMMGEDEASAEKEAAAARYRETVHHEETIVRLAEENERLRVAGRQEIAQAKEYISWQAQQAEQQADLIKAEKALGERRLETAEAALAAEVCQTLLKGQANMESTMNAEAITMARYAEYGVAEAAQKTEQEAERRFK